MSHRNQLMNPGQEMLDDNIEYTTERRFPVAYEIRPTHSPSHDSSPPATPSKRQNVASREFASSTPKLWTRWSKTLERDVATAILMGGRLEIRKNIPRKLTRIRKPALIRSKEAKGGRRWASRITPLRSLCTKIRDTREASKRSKHIAISPLSRLAV
ncbi:hypothetical protein ALC60_03010 [Trachymyrmex zeteki]|uniref:Uncharacterized protein n=1 Tax=Mycetomoellerius zeteki TaxID=64791 RepID=A0A151XC55_9HYME|nr:hypothetical protein ALC60_03010 [Trachymyrmex zeteki]